MNKEYNYKLSQNTLRYYIVVGFICLIGAIVFISRTDFLILKLLSSNNPNKIQNKEIFDSNICKQTTNATMKKSVLITGGGGFVGRHFSNRFCKLGWDVIIIDNLIAAGSLEPKYWPKHLQCSSSSSIVFYKMDCRTYFKECTNTKFDLLIHLAAVVGGRAIIEGQPLIVADDLSIDAAAFQWALKTNISSMIYFSSSAAYPIKKQTNIAHQILTESMIDVTNPNQDLGFPDLSYGWAKLTGS
jgi:nucleoside-diphosphate-sugar epimerase